MPALETGVRAAAGALSFLTRVPVGRRVVLDGDDVARGAVLFPLVGAGIGALVGLVVVGLDARLTVLVAAGLAVAFEALLTGAIHLDAVADWADGLGAGSRERALEVMREPAPSGSRRGPRSPPGPTPSSPWPPPTRSGARLRSRSAGRFRTPVRREGAARW
jgi:hypothetical protein